MDGGLTPKVIFRTTEKAYDYIEKRWPPAR